MTSRNTRSTSWFAGLILPSETGSNRNQNCGSHTLVLQRSLLLHNLLLEPLQNHCQTHTDTCGWHLSSTSKNRLQCALKEKETRQKIDTTKYCIIGHRVIDLETEIEGYAHYGWHLTLVCECKLPPMMVDLVCGRSSSAGLRWMSLGLWLSVTQGKLFLWIAPTMWWSCRIKVATMEFLLACGN